jgi:hypothetical protein
MHQHPNPDPSQSSQSALEQEQKLNGENHPKKEKKALTDEQLAQLQQARNATYNAKFDAKVDKNLIEKAYQEIIGDELSRLQQTEAEIYKVIWGIIEAESVLIRSLVEYRILAGKNKEEVPLEDLTKIKSQFDQRVPPLVKYIANKVGENSDQVIASVHHINQCFEKLNLDKMEIKGNEVSEEKLVLGAKPKKELIASQVSALFESVKKYSIADVRGLTTQWFNYANQLLEKAQTIDSPHIKLKILTLVNLNLKDNFGFDKGVSIRQIPKFSALILYYINIYTTVLSSASLYQNIANNFSANFTPIKVDSDVQLTDQIRLINWTKNELMHPSKNYEEEGIENHLAHEKLSKLNTLMLSREAYFNEFNEVTIEPWEKIRKQNSIEQFKNFFTAILKKRCFEIEYVLKLKEEVSFRSQYLAETIVVPEAFQKDFQNENLKEDLNRFRHIKTEYEQYFSRKQEVQKIPVDSTKSKRLSLTSKEGLAAQKTLKSKFKEVDSFWDLFRNRASYDAGFQEAIKNAAHAELIDQYRLTELENLKLKLQENINKLITQVNKENLDKLKSFGVLRDHKISLENIGETAEDVAHFFSKLAKDSESEKLIQSLQKLLISSGPVIDRLTSFDAISSLEETINFLNTYEKQTHKSPISIKPTHFNGDVETKSGPKIESTLVSIFKEKNIFQDAALLMPQLVNQAFNLYKTQLTLSQKIIDQEISHRNDSRTKALYYSTADHAENANALVDSLCKAAHDLREACHNKKTAFSALEEDQSEEDEFVADRNKREALILKRLAEVAEQDLPVFNGKEPIVQQAFEYVKNELNKTIPNDIVQLKKDFALFIKDKKNELRTKNIANNKQILDSKKKFINTKEKEIESIVNDQFRLLEKERKSEEKIQSSAIADLSSPLSAYNRKDYVLSAAPVDSKDTEASNIAVDLYSKNKNLRKTFASKLIGLVYHMLCLQKEFLEVTKGKDGYTTQRNQIKDHFEKLLSIIYFVQQEMLNNTSEPLLILESVSGNKRILFQTKLLDELILSINNNLKIKPKVESKSSDGFDEIVLGRFKQDCVALQSAFPIFLQTDFNALLNYYVEDFQYWSNWVVKEDIYTRSQIETRYINSAKVNYKIAAFHENNQSLTALVALWHYLDLLGFLPFMNIPSPSSEKLDIFGGDIESVFKDVPQVERVKKTEEEIIAEANKLISLYSNEIPIELPALKNAVDKLKEIYGIVTNLLEFPTLDRNKKDKCIENLENAVDRLWFLRNYSLPEQPYKDRNSNKINPEDPTIKIKLLCYMQKYFQDTFKLQYQASVKRLLAVTEKLQGSLRFTDKISQNILLLSEYAKGYIEPPGQIDEIFNAVQEACHNSKKLHNEKKREVKIADAVPKAEHTVELLSSTASSRLEYSGPLTINDVEKIVERIDFKKSLQDYEFSDDFLTQIKEAKDFGALEKILKEERSKIANRDSFVIENTNIRFSPYRDDSCIRLDRWTLLRNALIVASGAITVIKNSPRRNFDAVTISVASTNIKLIDAVKASLYVFCNELLDCDEPSKLFRDKALETKREEKKGEEVLQPKAVLMQFYEAMIQIIVATKVCANKKQANHSLRFARDFVLRVEKDNEVLCKRLPHGLGGHILEFSSPVVIKLPPEEKQNNRYFEDPYIGFGTKDWYAQNCQKFGSWYKSFFHQNREKLRILTPTAASREWIGPGTAYDKTKVILEPVKNKLTIMHHSLKIQTGMTESIGVKFKNKQERKEVACYNHFMASVGYEGERFLRHLEVLLNSNALVRLPNKDNVCAIPFVHHTLLGGPEDSKKTEKMFAMKTIANEAIDAWLAANNIYYQEEDEQIKVGIAPHIPKDAIQIKIFPLQVNHCINFWSTVPDSVKLKKWKMTPQQLKINAQQKSQFLVLMADKIQTIKLAIPKTDANTDLLTKLDDLINFIRIDSAPKATIGIGHYLDDVTRTLIDNPNLLDNPTLKLKEFQHVINIALLIHNAVEAKSFELKVKIRENQPDGYDPRDAFIQAARFEAMSIQTGINIGGCASSADRFGEISRYHFAMILAFLATLRPTDNAPYPNSLLVGANLTLDKAQALNYFPKHLSQLTHDFLDWDMGTPITKDSELRGAYFVFKKNEASYAKAAGLTSGLEKLWESLLSKEFEFMRKLESKLLLFNFAKYFQKGEALLHEKFSSPSFFKSISLRALKDKRVLFSEIPQDERDNENTSPYQFLEEDEEFVGEAVPDHKHTFENGAGVTGEIYDTDASLLSPMTQDYAGDGECDEESDEESEDNNLPYHPLSGKGNEVRFPRDHKNNVRVKDDSKREALREEKRRIEIQLHPLGEQQTLSAHARTERKIERLESRYNEITAELLNGNDNHDPDVAQGGDIAIPINGVVPSAPDSYGKIKIYWEGFKTTFPATAWNYLQWLLIGSAGGGIGYYAFNTTSYAKALTTYANESNLSASDAALFTAIPFFTGFIAEQFGLQVNLKTRHAKWINFFNHVREAHGIIFENDEYDTHTLLNFCNAAIAFIHSDGFGRGVNSEVWYKLLRDQDIKILIRFKEALKAGRVLDTTPLKEIYHRLLHSNILLTHSRSNCFERHPSRTTVASYFCLGVLAVAASVPGLFVGNVGNIGDKFTNWIFEQHPDRDAMDNIEDVATTVQMFYYILSPLAATGAVALPRMMGWVPGEDNFTGYASFESHQRQLIQAERFCANFADSFHNFRQPQHRVSVSVGPDILGIHDENILRDHDAPGSRYQRLDSAEDLAVEDIEAQHHEAKREVKQNGVHHFPGVVAELDYVFQESPRRAERGLVLNDNQIYPSGYRTKRIAGRDIEHSSPHPFTQKSLINSWLFALYTVVYFSYAITEDDDFRYDDRVDARSLLGFTLAVWYLFQFRPVSQALEKLFSSKNQNQASANNPVPLSLSDLGQHQYRSLEDADLSNGESQNDLSSRETKSYSKQDEKATKRSFASSLVSFFAGEKTAILGSVNARERTESKNGRHRTPSTPKSESRSASSSVSDSGHSIPLNANPFKEKNFSDDYSLPIDPYRPWHSGTNKLLKLDVNQPNGRFCENVRTEMKAGRVEAKDNQGLLKDIVKSANMLSNCIVRNFEIENEIWELTKKKKEVKSALENSSAILPEASLQAQIEVLDATRKNNIETFKSMLESRPELLHLQMTHDPHGKRGKHQHYTLLMLAIDYLQIEIADFLLDKGIDVSVVAFQDSGDKRELRSVINNIAINNALNTFKTQDEGFCTKRIIKDKIFHDKAEIIKKIKAKGAKKGQEHLDDETHHQHTSAKPNTPTAEPPSPAYRSGGSFSGF